MPVTPSVNLNIANVQSNIAEIVLVTPSVKLNIANVQSNIAEIMPVTPSVKLNIANVQSNIGEIVPVTSSIWLNIANIQSEIGEFMLKWITTLSRSAERLYNSHHINIVETSGGTSLPDAIEACTAARLGGSGLFRTLVITNPCQKGPFQQSRLVF